jgi:hypothetical protein
VAQPHYTEKLEPSVGTGKWSKPANDTMVREAGPARKRVVTEARTAPHPVQPNARPVGRVAVGASRARETLDHFAERL